MLINEDFLNKLRQSFNLNLYEVRLWTAILSRGVSTAGELSDIADVPRSRTYDVLESLERKGFVIVKPEKPIKYMAIPPIEVLDRVQKRIKNELVKHSEKVDVLKTSEMMQELVNLYKQGIEPMQITDFSGALKGRHNIYDQLAYIIKNAKESVDIVTSEEGLLRKIRTLKPLLEKALNRGVKIRIIAPINKNEEVISQFSEFVKIKNNNLLEGRFCIVDGNSAVLMLTDDREVHPSYDMGFWVTSKYFAGALNHLFDQYWKGTSKIPTERDNSLEEEL